MTYSSLLTKVIISASMFVCQFVWLFVLSVCLRCCHFLVLIPFVRWIDTLRNNDVVITSKRRNFDAITSKCRRFDVTRRYYYVKCMFGGVKWIDTRLWSIHASWNWITIALDNWIFITCSTSSCQVIMMMYSFNNLLFKLSFVGSPPSFYTVTVNIDCWSACSRFILPRHLSG